MISTESYTREIFIATLKASCCLLSGLESLKKRLAYCGVEMDITSSGSIQASLVRFGAQCDDQDIVLVNWKG